MHNPMKENYYKIPIKKEVIMDVLAPISTTMTNNLTTLLQDEPLSKAKELFEKENIRHIPVVGFRKIIGILSKSDLLHFMRGTIRGKSYELLEKTRLRSWQVCEIMHKNVSTLQKEDTIFQALDVFKNNLIHCIPILDGEELVGIITPYDIVMQVRKEGMQMVDKIVIE